ncbi:MAG: universal stress protein [Caldilineaceae bacterium]
MIQHILVPLDGSRLAEAALPVAMGLAAQLRTRVTLLHIIEQNAPASVHGEPHLTTAAAAHTYLTAAVGVWQISR